MNICIITEPLLFNYGGILQNYALQTVLKNNGHTVYTFDLGKFNWFDWLLNASAITFHKLKGEKLHYEKTPYQRKLMETPLRRFVYSNISLVKPRQRKLNLNCLYKYNFEAIIVGSDQVWRPKYNHDIEDKFLLFAMSLNIKKIAYAASFGSDKWEFTPKQTNDCKKLIKNFNGVSVRENSGVYLCETFLDTIAAHVLDPTLLIHKEKYIQLCENIPYKKPFVFAYILDSSAKKEKELKRFADKHNLPLIIVHAEDKLSKHDTIEKWLSYFRDSKYVITDSFHGTAFAINFNKDFWVYGNEERGNSRFVSLLESFHITERLVINIPIEESFINWEKVNELLIFYRNESICWLNKFLVN